LHFDAFRTLVAFWFTVCDPFIMINRAILLTQGGGNERSDTDASTLIQRWCCKQIVTSYLKATILQPHMHFFHSILPTCWTDSVFCCILQMNLF